jgi:hypothetical protein
MMRQEAGAVLHCHPNTLTGASHRLNVLMGLAKVALRRRAEPIVGDPKRLMLPIALCLSRTAAEALTARAIGASRRLEDVVQEILERDASA